MTVRRRAVLGGSTLLAALALVVVSGETASALRPLVWTGGLVGVALIALAAVFRTAPAAAGGLLALGAAIVLRLPGAGLDLLTPVLGAALLVVAELATWSIEDLDLVVGAPGGVGRRLRTVGWLGLAGLGIGLCVVAGAMARDLVPPGAWRVAAAAVAAVLALALVVWATWRPRPRTDAC